VFIAIAQTPLSFLNDLYDTVIAKQFSIM